MQKEDKEIDYGNTSSRVASTNDGDGLIELAVIGGLKTNSNLNH
jgi:hypothetical protein